MKRSFVNQAVYTILLLCPISLALAAERIEPKDSAQYLNAVREFADNVLKYGRDTYGPKHTPLFVDGINVHTHEPVKWKTPKGEEWLLSNFASQQNLLRTLDGLSKITGDPKYRKAAEEAVRYAIKNLQSPSGLFYWGGHAAYDVQADEPCGRKVHELKGFYPYYELMWEVNSTATRRFIESFWAGHILNWSNLNMNRHYYEMSQPLKVSWDYKYDPTPVFKGGGFSPSSTAGDLYYAGAWLSKFTGEEKPLTWAKRLAYRYVETRHPNTGISARVFTVSSANVLHAHDEILGKLKPVPYTFPWQGHANKVLWDSHFGYDTPSPVTMMNRVTAPWICQLMLGELLGREGKEFIQWSLDELTAWGKVAYRRDDNTFVPMCYDGTVVEGYVCEEDSPLGLKGSKLEAVPAKITELWAYTLAYCLTKDPFMWEMARNIALANDCGDIGANADDQSTLNLDTALSDPYAMVVFLELHNRIGKEAFLRMAQRIGNNVLAHRFYKGFVSPEGQYTFTKFDAVDPLALLHLHAALFKDRKLNIPKVWPGTSFFEEAYRSKDPVDDNQLIYSLKGTSQPPKSLQEAAAEGNVEAVKSMIAQGVDINKIEDGFKKTALHRAAMSGHKEVARLLINHGVRLDAKDAWPGGTPLHYAAEKGHKEIVELLITRGADVDSIGGTRNETPLHFASRNGQKTIVEVLVTAGADVNAKNNEGRTPLDIAVMKRHKDIAQLLVNKGARLSSFMFSFRLRLLLAQKNKSDKTEETHQDQPKEEQGKEEQKLEDTLDDPNSSQPTDRPAGAQFYFPKPSLPLGGNVVTHKEMIPKSRSAKPGYLETFVDPHFGSKITRVSGDKGQPIPVIGGTWPQHCRNHYQKDPPWNANGSVLYLCKGCKMFLDGKTYEPLDLKTPPGPARFHPLKPDIMIVLSRKTNRIEQFNLRTGTSEILATFSGYSGFSYMSEGNISGNGRWIAPYAVKDGKQVTFAYDMKEKKKYPDIELTGWDIDWVSICFSGKYVVVNGKATQNDITQIYESTTGREVGARWSRYGHPSHYDLGIDQDGDDVAVGVAKSNPNRGRCIMRRLKDGKEKALCPAGSHTGTRNTHRPGWAYIQSTHKAPYVDEVIAVELTWDAEPIVERLAYIPNAKVDYLSETHGAVSFDGKKFCAVSNWGIPGGQVQAYVVDMTDLCSSSVDGNRN